MTGPARPDPEPEPELAIDPLADLLFSLVAIVVLAVIVLLPTLRTAGGPSVPGIATELARATFSQDDRPLNPIYVTAAGVVFGPPGGAAVPVDRIIGDAGLAGWLEDRRRSGPGLLVLIAPDGLEAAFELEVVLAAHGPPSIRQVRLDTICDPAPAAGCTRGAP